MPTIVDGLIRAAELAELWASMSDGHAEVSRKKGDLRQADRWDDVDLVAIVLTLQGHEAMLP